jgi:protein SCO1
MGAVVVLALAVFATVQIRARENLASDFQLTDQAGKAFRLSDERGHAVAIYFGYTRCTDTCLTTMAHLASARRAMGSAGARTRVIFVTIDPAHDTPGVLKEYLAHFDSSFIGLTGTQAELAPVYRAYHVAFEAAPNPKPGADPFEMHTSVVWIIDAGGHPSHFADSNDTTSTLANDLREAS